MMFDGSVASLTTWAGANRQYLHVRLILVSSGFDRSTTNRFQYTAREFDSESGLYYYRARYYDPNMGRFINEDPVAFCREAHLCGY
jgi:RHS repeat-associated protein